MAIDGQGGSDFSLIPKHDVGKEPVVFSYFYPQSVAACLEYSRIDDTL